MSLELGGEVLRYQMLEFSPRPPELNNWTGWRRIGGINSGKGEELGGEKT